MTNQTATPHVLKPCPFCGEQRIYLSEGREGGINCPSCLARIPNECDDTEEMVACWNARAMDWDDPALVDEVAKAIYEKQKHAMGFGKTWDQLKESQPHSRTSHRHLVTEAAQAAIAAIRKAL